MARQVFCRTCAQDGIRVRMSKLRKGVGDDGELIHLYHCPNCLNLKGIPSAPQRRCPKCSHTWREKILYRPQVEPRARPEESEDA